MLNVHGMLLVLCGALCRKPEKQHSIIIIIIIIL